MVHFFPNLPQLLFLIPDIDGFYLQLILLTFRCAVEQGCQLTARRPDFLQQDFIVYIGPRSFQVCLHHFQLSDITDGEAVM